MLLVRATDDAKLAETALAFVRRSREKGLRDGLADRVGELSGGGASARWRSLNYMVYLTEDMAQSPGGPPHPIPWLRLAPRPS